VECLRTGVWRIQVDFADDPFVVHRDGTFNQATIQHTRQSPPARLRRGDDPIDVDKPSVAAAKPEKIETVIVGILVEGNQKCVGKAGALGKERVRDKTAQSGIVCPGQLDRVVVVQREQRRAERRRFLDCGQSDIGDRWIWQIGGSLYAAAKCAANYTPVIFVNFLEFAK
jgi:hypothetical protein